MVKLVNSLGVDVLVFVPCSSSVIFAGCGVHVQIIQITVAYIRKAADWIGAPCPTFNTGEQSAFCHAVLWILSSQPPAAADRRNVNIRIDILHVKGRRKKELNSTYAEM